MCIYKFSFNLRCRVFANKHYGEYDVLRRSITIHVETQNIILCVAQVYKPFILKHNIILCVAHVCKPLKSKGKVFYGQEPPSRESTTTECGFNYQLLAVIY